MVDKWADSYVKSKELPTRIMALAKKEGLSDDRVRREIESALRARDVSEGYIRQVMPAQLKRQYPSERKPVAKSVQSTNMPAALPKPSNTEDHKHEKMIQIRNDEDAEMEAMAQRYEQRVPAAQGDDLNTYVLPNRLALFKVDESAKMVMRDLSKLKAEGWKVVELTARRIT